MPTEVRDNKQGQKNTPKGQDDKQFSADDRKQGALLHGHGKNQPMAQEKGTDSKTPASKSGESKKSGG